jgi:predicted metal-binding membrane protein
MSGRFERTQALDGTEAGGRGLRLGIPVTLAALAAVGWWWSLRMADDMRHGADDGMGGMAGMGPDDILSLGAFVVAWLAMMTAMMFPAISPVVKLYSRASAARRVAPLPFFVAGYVAVWTSLGLPGYAAWRALTDALAEGRPWAGRLAGAALVLAAVWQLTPLKSVCLRHCRSPMSFFLRFGGRLAKPLGALRMGATHAVYCVGCCWALMAVLVAVGTMNPAWMLGLAVLIFLEKNAPQGERVALGAAAVFVLLGVLLLVRPSTIATLT